jgi:hypothetical protein
MSIRRRIFVAATVVGISFALVSCEATTESSSDSANASDTTEVADTTVAPSDTIGTGFGSKDASADIVSVNCGSPDAIGFSYPSVTVKNNSSKASDYIITVTFESADGSVKYDDSMLIINTLQPGQSTSEEGLPVSDVPAGAICKVTEVSRTASN